MTNSVGASGLNSFVGSGLNSLTSAEEAAFVQNLILLHGGSLIKRYFKPFPGETLTPVTLKTLYYPVVTEWFLKAAFKGFERATALTDDLVLGFLKNFVSATLADTLSSHPGWELWTFRQPSDSYVLNGGGIFEPASTSSSGIPGVYDGLPNELSRQWSTARATVSSNFDIPVPIEGMFWASGDDLLAVHLFDTPIDFGGPTDVNVSVGDPLIGTLATSISTTSPASQYRVQVDA